MYIVLWLHLFNIKWNDSFNILNLSITEQYRHRDILRAQEVVIVTLIITVFEINMKQNACGMQFLIKG